MNKSVVLKIVAICAAVFLVFGIITAILAVGFAKNYTGDENYFRIGQKGEPFEYHKNEVLNLENINQINIDVVSSDVIFYESESELEVTLDCYGYTNAETVTLYTEKDGTTLKVQVKYPKLVFGNLNITESLLQIGVPAGYAENISVNSVSADIIMKDYLKNSFEVFDVDTVSGDANIQCTAIDSLLFNSTSGRLTVSDTTVSYVTADTTSGDLDIKNISAESRKVSINTVSGKVSISYDKLCETVIDTTSGDVRLSIPGGVAIDLDFDSVSGDIDGNYTSNSNGIPVSIDTVSGDLIIN